MTTTPEAPPPLPDPHWPREYFGAVPSGAYTADQMHAYIRAERAARQEAQRQLYAERERLYKLVSDEQVKASRLHAVMKQALEALERFNSDMCAVVHHSPKDRHDLGDTCPVYAKHEAAIAALRANLRAA